MTRRQKPYQIPARSPVPFAPVPRRALAAALALGLVLLSTGGPARAYSLLPGPAPKQAGQGAALVPAAARRPGPDGAVGPSLFRDRADRSLFAPVPPRLAPGSGRPVAPGARRAPHRPVPLGGTVTARLRHLIASAEADPARGYDSVQHGARILPPRPPTAMTLAQIFDWIAATPGQPHAIGRYQVIPATLRDLARRLDLPATARFSPALQDALADQLLIDAGYATFLDGRLSRRGFMRNLARIWAGLPGPDGRSHYHGVAGNRAVIGWATFEAEMARIFPG